MKTRIFGVLGNLNGRALVRLGVWTAVFFVAVGSSQAGDVGTRVVQWADTLALDARVIAEIDQFAADEGGEFADGYARDLAEAVRRLIFEEVGRRLDAIVSGDVEPFVEVSYPEAGFTHGSGETSGSDTQRDFEDSFVRTELLAVFGTDAVPPDSALSLYTGADFRKKVSSRIERIWDENGENCVEVSGIKMLLSPMLNCSRIDELHLPGLAVQHSQVVSNGGGDGYQRVYFKESVKSFVEIPGGLVFHYINYSRTVGMGGLKKSIARKKIKGSQEEAVEHLREILARESAGAARE